LSSEVSTYPVLFNKEIYDLNQLKYIDLGLDKTLPSIDEIQKAISGTEEKKSTLIESGILDDLNHIVNVSNDDYFKITYPKYTDDITINNMIKEDIEDYYKIRVYAQATQICDCIDGLVMLDKYPQQMFGAYKRLRDFVHATPDRLERVRALNQLRIIAKSIIPPKIKFEQVEQVEPSLVSSAPTREG
jgi:hypothetical protein